MEPEILTLFGERVRKGKINREALEEFGREIIAGIELASPARIPAQDAHVGLLLIQLGTSMIFRASVETAGPQGMELALSYATGLGEAKVRDEVWQSMLHVVSRYS